MPGEQHPERSNAEEHDQPEPEREEPASEASSGEDASNAASEAPAPLDGDDASGGVQTLLEQGMPASWASSDPLSNLANILTVVLALTAIGLSIWEGYQNREFFRLSVLPNLEPREATTRSVTLVENELFPLLGNRDSLYAVSYTLENTGLGPAVLQNILMYREGEKVFDAAQSDSTYYLGPVRDDMVQLPFSAGFLVTPYGAGDMLEADEVHSFMTAIVPFEAVNEDSLEQWPGGIVQDRAFEQYSFVFCYCSVYGTDCGQTHLGAEPPEADVCDF